MKTTLFSAMFMLCISIAPIILSAKTTHNETTTFTVYGNCDMCKNRIEAALKKNSAIKEANWNQRTKILTVTYDPHAISLTQIHTIVAEAGHDTDKVKASDATYTTLPGCCKYKRTK